MKLDVIARRLALAYDALTGRLYDVHDAAEKLRASETLVQHLREVIDKVHVQRQYWYDVWFSQGSEFENSMSAMMNEINALRAKLGIKGEKWEEVVKAYHQRHVAPPSHPIPKIATELKQVPAPPEKPKEAASEQR